jgi:hypothetical protein
MAFNFRAFVLVVFDFKAFGDVEVFSDWVVVDSSSSGFVPFERNPYLPEGVVSDLAAFDLEGPLDLGAAFGFVTFCARVFGEALLSFDAVAFV